MPSNIPLDKFRSWFARHGIQIEPAGKHYKMRGTVDGKVVVYTLPLVSGREVKHVYLKLARKAFSLLPKNGVSDDKFFG